MDDLALWGRVIKEGNFWQIFILTLNGKLFIDKLTINFLHSLKVNDFVDIKLF